MTSRPISGIEHDLRPGQSPRLDLVAADELHAEAEDAVREQVRLERVAVDGQERPAGHDDPEGDGLKADLVQHARVHRPVAAGATREGGRGLGRDGHAPRQVGRRPEWQLREEAAHATDDERERDGGRVVVAGRAGVSERALAQDDGDVASDEPADDAARAVGHDVGERQVRRLHLVDHLPAGEQACADHTADDRGQADDDDARVEDPVSA